MMKMARIDARPPVRWLLTLPRPFKHGRLVRLSRSRVAALAVGVICLSSSPGLALGVGATGTAAVYRQPLRLQVLSTRADLVSFDSTLTQVVLPPGVSATQVKLTLNGSNVTSEFARRPNGLDEGLLTGLRLGRNTLRAIEPNGAGAQLVITDHPTGGPVFSGPQIQPWPCLATPPPTDAQCDTPITYTYTYKSAVTGQMESYNPASPPPAAAIASVTTDKGVTVPYIVRQEQGALDRGQYAIAGLWQPGKPWLPWAPQKQWNSDLELAGGAGCGNLHGESAAPSVQDANGIGLGFLVGSTSLDNNGPDCNLVVQAESIVMLRERIVDEYGPIQFTIGTGCSGGSIFQVQIANAYPGTFNATTPECSFPDSWGANVEETLDCQLMLHYWGGSGPASRGIAWTPAQEAAATGEKSLSLCESWVNVYGGTGVDNPELQNGGINFQDCGVTAAQAWSPSNPKGVRCDISDFSVDELGRNPTTGYANNPYDNVGIPYGFQALESGAITPAEFADLNAYIGGVDKNDFYSAARSTADLAALPVLYRSGFINEANGLCGVPIVDLRGHDSTEIHQDYRTYIMRARLDKACGNHNNQIVITGPIPLEGASTFPQVGFDINNQWLTNIFNDHRAVSLPTKVAQDKPADAVDTCVDASGQTIPCEVAGTPVYPYYKNPRIAAGEPFTDDIMKCQLRPLTRAEFLPVQFSSAEWAQLRLAFPTGICNYALPGVGQQPTVPWMSYMSGPGGAPLGPAPQSVALAATSAGASAVVPASASSTKAVSASSAPLADTGLNPLLPLAALAALVAGLLLYRRQLRR